MFRCACCCSLIVLAFAGHTTLAEQPSAEWLAGDHHVHSRYSVGPDYRFDPPAYRIGLHGRYTIPKNAYLASQYGLSWMVSTDHGGRNHAKMNLEQAYPELLLSRKVVPNVIQFFGFEINTPGADHASIIVPRTYDEG